MEGVHIVSGDGDHVPHPLTPHAAVCGFQGGDGRTLPGVPPDGAGTEGGRGALPCQGV